LGCARVSCSRVTASSRSIAAARPVFERVVREYGLPGGIRTDNGVRFATQAVHGLSYLNVWWMRLSAANSPYNASALATRQ